MEERPFEPAPASAGRAGARTTVAEAKQAAGAIATAAKEETADLAAQARDRMRQTVSDRRRRAGRSLDQLARAVLAAAHKLDEDEERTLSSYAVEAARRVEGLARYVGDKDVGEIVRDAETFARRHPTLFLSGAVGAGLLFGRFIKSSQRRTPEPPMAPLSEEAFAATPASRYGG